MDLATLRASATLDKVITASAKTAVITTDRGRPPFVVPVPPLWRGDSAPRLLLSRETMARDENDDASDIAFSAFAANAADMASWTMEGKRGLVAGVVGMGVSGVRGECGVPGVRGE